MGRFAKLANDMADIQRLAWNEAWFYAEEASSILLALSGQKRRAVAVALIDQMLAEQGGICPLCREIIDRSTLGAFHIDHVIPFSYGGGYERSNLQVVHPLCNQRKGDFGDIRDLIPYLERKASEL